MLPQPLRVVRVEINIDFEKYNRVLDESLIRNMGRVENVIGLSIESKGPEAKLGDLCKIFTGSDGEYIYAEVIGFKDKKTLLSPYQATDGISIGCRVENTGSPLMVTVSDKLLGHVLDSLGNCEELGHIEGARVEVDTQAMDAMDRVVIDEVLSLGVKAVDGLLTIGKGQRIGIFAGSGVGKSTLMGMFARNTNADINVIALIGERGREVKEFIERDLGPEGMARSVVVVATSDRTALERKKAAMTATAIAEYFRDSGKDVLLMMDSLTRFSMAQREIGLASGEPPVSRGYPPSVYSQMPRLLERAGKNSRGSITGLYTVLVDGDDFNEPITDTARGILDGHIVLDRKLAQKNHYPAIDVLASVSRCMSGLVSREHKKYAGKLKSTMATYRDAEDLINIGAYKAGSNPDIDYSITMNGPINEYLCQETDEKFDYDSAYALLEQMFGQPQ